MSKRTILDRSIVPVVPNADDTASRRQGVSASTERYHRLHGTSLLFDASCLLEVSSASCYATACVLFHRFCHQVSLLELDVWSAAMGSLLLAIKMEELTITLKQVVSTFYQLYRRRKLVLFENDDETKQILKHTSIAFDQSATLPYAQKIQLISEKDTPLNPFGPLWKEWHAVIVEVESKILRALGFTVYWIPDNHPHKFILYFLRVLEVDNNKQLAQSAWNYCNDSCRLNLCMRFEAHIVACATIRLAAHEQRVSLPDSCPPNKPKCSWWEVFCGPGHEASLDVISKELLEMTISGGDSDVVMASVAFVKSLVSNGSFNDPGSFSWETIQ